MRDYFRAPLPHGYGVAQLDPPNEKIPWCNCGHSWEDHSTRDERCLIPECECKQFEESDGIDPRY